MDGYVFFITGKGRSFKRNWVAALIRLITLSHVCHCTFAYDGVVVDPNLSGVRHWPLNGFVRRYPGLYGAFRVPLWHEVDTSFFVDYKKTPQKILPRLFRLLRLGHGKWIYDCLCIVMAYLQAGGVDVPSTICTPKGLFKWLKRRGFEYVPRERFGMAFGRKGAGNDAEKDMEGRTSDHQ